MAINRYVKKAGMIVGMLGIIAGCFQGIELMQKMSRKKRATRKGQYHGS
ncbi:cell wall surface anchor family protein [Enterococcus hirae]|nr:cell wall surface anchor family protein [Enterococcus hirae]